MADHRIVCTTQTGCTSAGHIQQVGLGTKSTHYDSQITVATAWNMIDRGDRFYTYGEVSKKAALVEKFYCGCGAGSLRSVADCTTDNNLDSLGMCT